ncbi:hypothetical protein [Kineobactrum salinum]|uniref:Uncharacterized protein n=1 Tax=Kineobactrum salinum TaxID=2708301 RepID=A0A6C0TZX0_9GAMM|nr:hypothetical protein [Kineobactrum salinum]QIB65306.1 hypothetical protein G3T16_07730 [Kineobactrum salinum]
MKKKEGLRHEAASLPQSPNLCPEQQRQPGIVSFDGAIGMSKEKPRKAAVKSLKEKRREKRDRRKSGE